MYYEKQLELFPKFPKFLEAFQILSSTRQMLQNQILIVYCYELIKEVSVDVAMTSSWNGNDGSRLKSSWALYFIIISFWEACCCMLCHTIIIIMMIAMWELEYFFRKSHFCNELPLSTKLPRLSSNVGSHYLVLHRMWSNINQDKPWQKLSN